MSNTLDFLDAVKAGDLARVRAILETSPELSQVRDEAGVSAVMLATYYGQADIAEELARLHIGLDIFEASALGHNERVVELLEADAALVNKYSADSFTPLGFAAFFGHPETARLLVERGANVHAASRNAMLVQPLHSAVANRQPDAALRTAEVLLRHGADPNARQHGGWAPLHQAASHGHEAVVQLLLTFGADPAVRSEDGKTPRDMALKKDHKDVVRLLDTEQRPRT